MKMMVKEKLQINENMEVAKFLIYAYAISWALWILSDAFDNSFLEIAGRFGPLLSVLILLDKKELKELLSKLFVRGVKVKWYVISLFGPVFIVLPAIWINQMITGIKPEYNDPNEWYLIIVAFFYVLFLSVLGEEAGWRGFALPRLLKKYSSLKASLIIGLAWGLWHLPLFFMEGEFHQSIPYPIFLLNSIALSIIMTWLYQRTKGSLTIAHLFHTSSNVTLGILPMLPMDTNGDMGALYIALGLLIIASTTISVKAEGLCKCDIM